MNHFAMVYLAIKNSKYPDYTLYVEALDDFMFQEGWRVHAEVPASQVTISDVAFAKDYFDECRYVVE